jgi:hypothetical protein
MTDVDVPLPVVEARVHLSWLQAHPVPADAPLKARHDWLAAAFRDLAACHPEACTCDADIPGWAEHIAALEAANRRTPEETL